MKHLRIRYGTQNTLGICGALAWYGTQWLWEEELEEYIPFCMYGTIRQKYKTLGPNYGAIELCGVLVLRYEAIELCGLLAVCHGTPGLLD